ncbi:Ssrp [Trypoxylus dichotomus]
MLWLNENREKIKGGNSGISVTEIAKKGGELWKELKDKTEWEKKTAKAKEEYQKAIKEYKESGGGADDSKKKSSKEYIESNDKSSSDDDADKKSNSKRKASHNESGEDKTKKKTKTKNKSESEEKILRTPTSSDASDSE